VTYAESVERLVAALGSQRALARQLGVAQGTLAHRLSNPHLIKREHELALAELLRRIERDD
jgi:hypothetical protein